MGVDSIQIATLHSSPGVFSFELCCHLGVVAVIWMQPLVFFFQALGFTFPLSFLKMKKKKCSIPQKYH